MPDNARTVEIVVRRSLPYLDGVELQRQLLAEVAGDPARPGSIIFAEHNPVITCGRSGDGSNLLVNPETLASDGIEYHESRRGGDVTYHGPGQWTIYPFFMLYWFGRDLHRYLRLLEECVIRFVARYGLVGTRRPGLTGAWVDGKKIAAVGIAVSRWITWHGIAVNICPDLSRFTRYMHPCGITADQGGVASLASLTNINPDMEQTMIELRQDLCATLELVLV